jgi:hypothetical protein
MRRGSTITLIVAALIVACFGAATAGARAPRWASESHAAIHPGVMTFTGGAQCTANFVFYDRTSVYLGQAAHCSGTGASDQTDGCQSPSLRLGTHVTVDGARHPGLLVYNSWLSMHRGHEHDANTCAYNDLALIRIDRRDVKLVNPTIPFFGGPVGLATATSAGQDVFSYGNSSLRGGVATLSPKRGVSLGQDSGGWNHTVYTVTPGIPGDSGSGFVDDRGRAFGVLSTVALAPLAASNGVGDLSRELRYLAHHTKFRVSLARGTRGFSSGG